MSVFLPSELQNVFININLPLSVVSFFFLVFIFQLKKYRYKLIVTSVTDAWYKLVIMHGVSHFKKKKFSSMDFIFFFLPN